MENTLSKLVQLLQLKISIIVGKNTGMVLCSLLEMLVQSLKLTN